MAPPKRGPDNFLGKWTGPAVYTLPRFWRPQELGQAHLVTGPEDTQAVVTSSPWSEITEDADVSEVSPVAVGVEAE